VNIENPGSPDGADVVPEGAAAPVHEIDDYDLDAFKSVAARFGQDRYGYVVTPNVDHLIRFHEDADFRDLYQSATYVVLDSRFVSHLLRVVKGLKLSVCTGADLTAALLDRVIDADDRVVVIGGTADQAKRLAATYGLRNMSYHNPPMGFITSPAAVEECLKFIESKSPFRFCFLAVGSPQQERIAQLLQQRGVARGLALCVGASLNFLTGAEKRAPAWMQQSGLEWLHRLLQDPRRLATRYLLRGPRIFLYLCRARIVRRAPPRSEPPRPRRA
jgi:exopolysaccharide biosynthesis WecB/TagA/CpsF family protein